MFSEPSRYALIRHLLSKPYRQTEVPLRDVWYLPGPHRAAEIPSGHCHTLCLLPALSPSAASELLPGFGLQFCHRLQTYSDVV